MDRSLTLVLLFCAALIVRLQAYTICSGVLDSPKVIKGGVKVVGSCMLRDVVVKGPVKNNDGKLVTEGTVLIYGNVFSAGQGTALGGKTAIYGKLTTGGTALHTFAKDVWLKELVIAGLESINELSGFAGKVLFASASEFRLLNEGKVGYGGVIAKGITAVGINQVRIGFGGSPSATVLGPVVVKNVKRLSFGASNVSFMRNIVIKDTSGSVFIGAITKFGNARLAVKNFEGSLNFQETTLPPTVIANVEGSIVLDGGFDKYFKVKDVTGVVQLGISSGTGPFTLLRTGPVASATRRDEVFVSNVVGPVKILQNKQLKLTLIDNTGGAKLVGNTMKMLTCTNNHPAPVGFGNTFSVAPSGQCKNLN